MIWTLDIDTYLEIVFLAQNHGKKVGSNMQEEFEEILKKKKDRIKLIGVTDKDVDQLTGDLREERLKVLNLKEVERRNRENRRNRE